MTIKEFLDVYEDDIGVYDNYCEELGIAYCGNKLTSAGEEHFAEALALPVIEIRKDVAIIGVDMPGLKTKEIEHRLKIAKDFFESAAGYCSAENYDRWFQE